MSSPKSFKLSQLASLLGAELEGDPEKEIVGINNLVSASDNEISFIAREAFIPQLDSTSAGAVICNSRTSELYEGNKLVCANPYLIYANCTKLFKEKPSIEMGISNLASIASSSSISDKASIGSFVTISEDAIIDDDVILMPGVFVGKGSKVGKGTILHANTSLYDSVDIGQECIIHSGTVLGSDGLGFAQDNKQWVKIEHLGKVVIGNHVEIGSNSTIDRGSVGDTIIGDNVKIDNQVHIAHNVKIGANCMIAGQVGFAGSSRIGNNVSIGGQAGISGHLSIGNNVKIGGGSGVVKDIDDNQIVMGYPAVPLKEFLKNNKN